ncbi:MAG: hypothetical protein AAFV62_00945 [Pseudomonadota bacterium]
MRFQLPYPTPASITPSMIAPPSHNRNSDHEKGPSAAVLLREAVAKLGEAGVPEPQRDARVLLRWATGWSAAALAGRSADVVPPEAEARFAEAVTERARRRPVSHIIGTRAFLGREFFVSDAAHH